MLRHLDVLLLQIGARRSLPLLPPQSTMAPKFFRTSGPDKKNPSILVQDVDPDGFDLDDCWSGCRSNSASRCRASYPEKKAPSGFSRFTKLSSNMLSAGVAITTRAKQLQIRESTRRAINRLRLSTIDNLPRAVSMPTQHLFNEPKLDDYPDSSEPEEGQ